MVRQATQREDALAKNKKKAKKVWRRFDKEKEINWWVRGGESRSDMEAKLKSEEPIEMGDDTSAFVSVLFWAVLPQKMWSVFIARESLQNRQLRINQNIKTRRKRSQKGGYQIG